MSNQKIIDMTNKEARSFLLKASSYFTLKLPGYFNFQPLLDSIHKDNSRKTSISNFFKDKDNSKYYDDINYKIMINKSGKLSWRELVITNPIAYVAIVHQICKKDNWDLIINRFESFAKNKKIKCCSIPVEADNIKTDKKEQILNWWNEYEQLTIKESMNYQNMIITDISNCYPSIYTHTIPWALHGESFIKKDPNGKSKTLFGNSLDISIEAISYAQTNGIPQGSILFDFIAEIILGYCDELLTKRLDELKITDYKILRYRDDYRIFSNNSAEIEIILKELTIILNHHNLHINNKKTLKTNDIISNSLKQDKVYGLMNYINKELNPQKKIFVIRQVSMEHKNSGLLVRLLHEYYKNDIFPIKRQLSNPEEIISIIVDIMDNNPRVYPECIAILSKILSFYNPDNRSKKIDIIKNKLLKNSNVDYLNIWLQRITITFNREYEFETKLCQKLYNDNQIWNSSWSNYLYDESVIIDEEIIKETDEIISIEEIDDFLNDSYI